MKRIILLLSFLSSAYAGAQHQDKVDFYKAQILIEPIAESASVKGVVTYQMEVMGAVDSVFLDAHNIDFSSVLLDYKKVKYETTASKIIIYEKFEVGKEHSLTLEYSATPKQTLYFLGHEDEVKGNEQIWTQGQGKYTSHWLPSFDDMQQKVEYDLGVIADEKLRVIANGKLVSKDNQEPNTVLWIFDMQKPMSSYLLAFAIGRYDQQLLTANSGIPLENYYYPEDSLKVEPTFRFTKEIFDFLEAEIGVPYPWQNYKQLPVRDFLYAGMENTGATIFSDAFVIDSTAFIDKNYVNVNAHEMAHQWFGNLVTEKDGNHHWLHEGFATYYAYLAEKELFGDDHFYWKLFSSLQQLQDQVARGEGSSLLDPKASSLTFYEKGAWALFVLRNVLGHDAFRNGIKAYLGKYRFTNVTVDGFLKEMESASGKSLSEFRTTWLESSDLPFEQAKLQLVERAPSLKILFDLETELEDAQNRTIDYLTYWNSTNSIHLKKYLLKKHGKSMPISVLELAMKADSIPIRQSLLDAAPQPNFLPKEYLLALLDDNSYITKEMALFSLWQGYPEDRPLYLEKTKEVIGLPNKNVRLMWLTLAMLTEGYNSLKTKDYFDELSNYTKFEYSFEIRQGAFFYLKEAFGFNDQSLSSLVRASTHHSWQFRKYAREVLDGLLLDADYKTRLEVLANELKPKETRYLKSKLKSE